MTLLDIASVAVVVALIFCPPKYDPAIRWKERNERKKEDIE